MRFRRSRKLIEKWMPKVIQNGSKIQFGGSRGQILRFWKDLIEVRFLKIFWAAPKMKQIWKNEAKVWKERLGPEGWRQRRGPPRAFGVCKSIRIRQRLQKHSRRPVPCEQGAADFKATASAADPSENWCWWSLSRLLALRVLSATVGR